MSPNTRTQVKWLRWTQIVLRVCALLGALGLLFCVICIKPTNTTLDWIIRVPAGLAILHCVYAIYHLSRTSKGRTPASSASYMIFAAIIDAGLLPFLVFTAILSRNEYLEPPDTEGHWQTVFPWASQTLQILWATYLLSVTSGGIHVASLCLSIYLALVFRKISALPPDMNPLEDNLTSRHKRNKSSLSTAPTDATNRMSQPSEPLINGPRVVPFMHTRNESSASLQMPGRRPQSSFRASRTDVDRFSVAESTSFVRSSEILDAESSGKGGVYVFEAPASSDHASRPPSCRPGSTNSLGSEDNWTAYPSSSPPPPGAQMPPELQHLRGPPSRAENPMPQPLRTKYDFSTCSPRPLGLNPPTPPVSYLSREGMDRRALRAIEANARRSGWEQIDLDEDQAAESSQGSGFGMFKAGKTRGARVVSSGIDAGKVNGIRVRDVSGKIVEEGRA